MERPFGFFFFSYFSNVLFICPPLNGVKFFLLCQRGSDWGKGAPQVLISLYG